MSYTASGLWAPSQADFTDGPAGATLTDTRGGIHITHASNGIAHSLFGMYQAVPAAPYTVTAKFDFNGSSDSQAGRSTWGIFLSDGTLYQFFTPTTNAGGAGNSALDVNNFTTSAAFLGTIPSVAAPWLIQDIWLRISDDNANRTYSFSRDGVSFQQFYQVGRTVTLTPTRIGFAIDPIGAATDATLKHWRIT